MHRAGGAGIGLGGGAGSEGGLGLSSIIYRFPSRHLWRRLGAWLKVISKKSN